MSLLERVIIAHRCRSTHHYIAMDALALMSGPDAERWRNLILVHNEELLDGAKAPDAVFKDFKNHVLHIEEGEWGGARDAATQWYGEAVAKLREKKWGDAIYALGVLSHYYADPIQPFHTGQTEEEGAMHRAVEWSIAKSRDTIKERIEEIGYPGVEAGNGIGFVSDMVRAGAEKSHPHYQTLLDHYNLDVGAKNPPAGLDQTLIDIIAELVAYATMGLSILFSRAFEEAGVAAPKARITVPGYLATLDIPIRWVTKKLDDAGDKRIVAKMYREYKETGKVVKALPEDDKEIRKMHARQVLRRPIGELDEQALKPIGQKYEPRPEHAAFADEIAHSLAPESENEIIGEDVLVEDIVVEDGVIDAEIVEPESVEPKDDALPTALAASAANAPIEAVSEPEAPVAKRKRKSKKKKPVVRIAGAVGEPEDEAAKDELTVHEAEAFEQVEIDAKARLEKKRLAAKEEAKRKSEEAERASKAEQDRVEAEALAAKAEQERREADAKAAAEAVEAARLEAERVEAERLATEEAVRLEKARVEQDRLDAQESARIEAAQEAKRLESSRLEEARLEEARLKQERLEAEEFARLQAEEDAERREIERAEAEELALMEAEEAEALAAKEAQNMEQARAQARRAEAERRETEALKQAAAEEGERLEEIRQAARKLADEENAPGEMQEADEATALDDEFSLEELAAFDTNLTDNGTMAEAPPVASFFENSGDDTGPSTGRSRARLMPEDPVIDAPSIGKKTARRLNRVGIFTVNDLLECDVEEIAFELDMRHIDEPTLEDWKAQARLMIEVAGLRVHDAQILVGAGIRNGDDLANASATRIFHASMGFLKSSEGARIVRDDHVLEEAEVHEWIDMAKESEAA